jgi:hypothetical protein
VVELFQTQFDSCVFRVEYYLLVESYDDLSDWNRGNKIETKREKISNILLDLSSEQDNEQKMNIPSIQCLCYSFQFFHGTPDARLGYEVIKPRCLNTSTYFWTFSVRWLYSK